MKKMADSSQLQQPLALNNSPFEEEQVEDTALDMAASEQMNEVRFIFQGSKLSARLKCLTGLLITMMLLRMVRVVHVWVAGTHLHHPWLIVFAPISMMPPLVGFLGAHYYSQWMSTVFLVFSVLDVLAHIALSFGFAGEHLMFVAVNSLIVLYQLFVSYTSACFVFVLRGYSEKDLATLRDQAGPLCRRSAR